tara:strand:- start:12900 stop:13577 length:678 start_codon:yes stop_codon:yes gene_type:complete
MNWYKKAALVELDYRPQNAYTNVGHSSGPKILWWWDGRKLSSQEVEKGNEEAHFGVIPDEEKGSFTWQGRYDPETDDLSIAPRVYLGKIQDPPKRLVDALYKQFGDVKFQQFANSNWYKKAQLVELEHRPRNTYLDFGHDDSPVSLWWWDGQQLFVTEAGGDSLGDTHRQLAPEGITWEWQGRYDPKTDDLTILSIRPKFVEPPKKLLDDLYTQFGSVNYKMFSQ